VAVSVSVDTSDGGRTSSKTSAMRSSPYWVSARARVAPPLRCMLNIAPEIFTARSLSRMPSAVPTSQWGRRWWVP
jgi:hypothetical protein